MILSSTSPRAPNPKPFRAGLETPSDPASEHLKRRQSSDGCPQTQPAGFGAQTAIVIVTLLLVLLAAASSSADPSLPGPDEADLRHHFDCSRTATVRLLRLDEATGCARAFMRIKLAFVPGVGLDDYERLPPRQKAAVNLVGYRRYLAWRSENSADLEALRQAPPSSSAFAGN